tara:strand:+ start:79 stop:759 length:681 start_codon:yes stop_codon:yes gene_type:complete
VLLEGGAAKHLGRALRARIGDAVCLFNGDGREFAAAVTGIDKQTVSLEVGTASAPDTESRIHTTLGLCLSKGDRFDWAIQKATELGIGAIAPLYSDRVDFTIPADRMEKRVAHWQQVVISACEQCGRVRVPAVATPQPLEKWVEAAVADQKWVLHCGDGDTRVPKAVPARVALLIGPEGGLADEEMTAARGHGFDVLQLGPRVLRTETAPVVALSVLGAHWGDIPL